MKQIAFFAMAVCLCVSGCNKSPSANNDWKRVGGQGMVQFVVVSKDKEADQSVYDAAIASLCHQDRFCFLWFWSDPEAASAAQVVAAERAKASSPLCKEAQNRIRVCARLAVTGDDIFDCLKSSGAPEGCPVPLLK